MLIVLRSEMWWENVVLECRDRVLNPGLGTIEILILLLEKSMVMQDRAVSYPTFDCRREHSVRHVGTEGAWRVRVHPDPVDKQLPEKLDLRDVLRSYASGYELQVVGPLAWCWIS